jgi:hypothetical protein
MQTVTSLLGTFLFRATAFLILCTSAQASGQIESSAFPASALPPDFTFANDTYEVSKGASHITPLTPEQASKSTLVNCNIYCGTPVSYTSWQGNVTTMQEYRGLNVRLLVPQAWFDNPTFTEAMRHKLVNGFDLVYQYYVEIVGRRPGSDLDTVAFVTPVGCGSACGVVGGHGVELGDEYGYYVTGNSGPDTGVLAYAALHEMAHNFDSYGRSYKFPGLPSSSHFWTTMMQFFYRYVGNANQNLDREYYEALYRYLTLPAGTASWQNCVIAGQSSCGNARGYSAPIGLFFRIAHLYGQASITRWVAFMRSMDSDQATPTDADRLDHFFEGFSAAANRNVNCVLDELNWPISNNVRTWVNTNIGTTQQNPDCAIGPRGKSRVLDMAADFTPPATPNNRSDVNGAGFTGTLTLAFPGTFNTHGNGQSQGFQFSGVIGHRIIVFLCSPATGGYTGGTMIWFTGGWGIGGPSLVPGQCNTTTLAPTVNQVPTFSVSTQNSPNDHGAFSIIAAEAPGDPWETLDWGQLSVSQNFATGEFTLTVSAVDASKVTPASSVFPGPQKVKFWAQDYGWVAMVPWTPGATSYTAHWTPPAGAPAAIEFRAQVYANQQHGYASNQTRPVLFRDLIFENGFQ